MIKCGVKEYNMRSSKWLENVELKPFDKSDWNLLAGAESPYPDQEPLIGYAIPAFDWQEKYPEDEEIIIVVDKNGVGVIGLDVQFSHPCSF